MGRRTTTAEWKPSGIEGLETSADAAVKHRGNTLVVAGPGAGKTELLAQKACYLLQTGLCSSPRKILAVSFKRDAARNLQERVLDRCGVDLARRFHSMTFDAFAKSIVDRFGQALPKEWRPTSQYVLDFKIESQFGERLHTIPKRFSPPDRIELAMVQFKRSYKQEFAGRRLSDLSTGILGPEHKAALSMWKFLLHGQEKSVLNFHMIGRLAEHIFATNPKILEAFRASYIFSFIDEFQDTTSIQYALALTLFKGSNCQLTAVGDSKQSIMRWAFAQCGVFDRFRIDFDAKVFRPVRNYRSAPKLVQIIGSLASIIESDSVIPEAVDDGETGAGECRVLKFKTTRDEVSILVKLIKGWVEHDGVLPEEICVLTRQTPETYTAELMRVLRETGIHARIESQIQDLLAEPITEILLDAFALATTIQAPKAWQRLESTYLLINGCDSEHDAGILSKDLARFITSLRVICTESKKNQQSVSQAIELVVQFVGMSILSKWFVQYSQGTFLDEQLKLFATEFNRVLVEAPSWKIAIDRFLGIGSIPIMTIHKSKGLEFHTIVFIGLEDYAFRNLRQVQDDEEACAFFVAFSRASKRVVFTFSSNRNGSDQTSSKVKPLFDILLKSGIKAEEF